MTEKLNIEQGAEASREITVTPELTVAHYHPEMPAVYGTPMMIYLMEVVSGDALAPYLPQGWVSLGVDVNVRHLAATPVGARVTVTARIARVDETTVTFEVEAYDDLDRIGAGTHVRAPVEMSRLLNGIEAKKRKLGL